MVQAAEIEVAEWYFLRATIALGEGEVECFAGHAIDSERAKTFDLIFLNELDQVVGVHGILPELL